MFLYENHEEMSCAKERRARMVAWGSILLSKVLALTFLRAGPLYFYGAILERRWL